MEEHNEVTEAADVTNAFDPPEVPELPEASSPRRHALRTPLAAGLAAGLLGVGVGAGAVAVFANDEGDHDRGRHEEAFDRLGDREQDDHMGDQQGGRHQRGDQPGQPGQQSQQGQQQQGGFMPPSQDGPSQGRSGGS